MVLIPVSGTQWDTDFLLHLGSDPGKCSSGHHRCNRWDSSLMPSDAGVDNSSSSLIRVILCDLN